MRNFQTGYKSVFKSEFCYGD